MYGDDKTRIPQNNGTPVDCAEFEVLLADALDGKLDEVQIERFDAHLATCARCAPMFGESKLGQAYIQTLKAEELEPPAFIIENILRETVGTVHQKVKIEDRKTWWDRLKESRWLQPVTATVMQPRFAMSFGMAFFSITILLNVLGVKISSLKNVDVRPSSVVQTYYETKGKFVKYYENIRWVYELESRIRDLMATPAEPEQQQQPQQETRPENRETSGAPELKSTPDPAGPQSSEVTAANSGQARVAVSTDRS